MEYIWHDIKRNLPRRVTPAVLKSGTIVWIVLFGIIGFCLWEGIEWWNLNTSIEDVELSIQPAIDSQLKILRKEINVKKNQLAQLEGKAFSLRDQELVSWITQQAKAVNTEIIGVEYLKERRVELYIYAPVKFTLRGDYHSFGRLINRLEHSRYPVKIDYLAITRQRNAPQYLVMNLVLSTVSTRH